MYFVPFLVIGAIVAAGLFALVLWLRSRDVRLTWYEWLIGAIGLLLLMIGAQHYFGALTENFLYAAWMGLLIIGGPGIILLLVAWLLVARRQRAG